jgi:hypothetical protein
VAIPRNYNITITVVFIPEIPSMNGYKTITGHDYQLASLGENFSEFSVPKKFVFTVDRYTSIKNLRKLIVSKLSPYLQLFYNEKNIFLFESLFNPSKKLLNKMKTMKFVNDRMLLNQLSSMNSLLVAYGLCLENEHSEKDKKDKKINEKDKKKGKESSQGHLFVHLVSGILCSFPFYSKYFLL